MSYVVGRRANGPQMGRPASQGQYRAEAKHPAGQVRSSELLGIVASNQPSPNSDQSHQADIERIALG